MLSGNLRWSYVTDVSSEPASFYNQVSLRHHNDSSGLSPMQSKWTVAGTVLQRLRQMVEV
jgi:hypothetical protein